MSKRRVYISPLGREIQPAPARELKRLLECLAALIAIITISPLLVVLALMVKLTSRGPIFYTDTRLGLGGQPYRMVKFRSMKVGSPPILTADGKLIVTKKDPRLTPIGRFLRMGFDELPQLFNVLAGHMSFVGPRSGRPQFEKDYTEVTYERLRVRPGITGLASILGGRHISNESLFQLDARYVQRQDGFLDVLIILLTPVYIILGPRIPRLVLRPYIRGIELKQLKGQSAEQ